MKKTIQKLAAKLISPVTRIIRNINQEPPAQAHQLDVDTVHAALRQAETGDCTDLFAIYRDILASHSHILSEFQKRKLAVLNEPLTLTPADSDNDAEAAFVKSVEDHINNQPNLIWVMGHLLDSALYPVAVAERLYRHSPKLGWRYEIATMSIVPHTHLTWATTGRLSLKDTDEEGNFTGTYSEILPREFIIHRGHLLTSVPD